ncbi:MAG: serine hydrolase domain-containing protein [Desulfobaccales bacterium]
MHSPLGAVGQELQEVLEEGRDQGVYTAAVAVVGLKGEVLWQGAAGQLSQEPHSPPASLETLFDLASLTKPLATTLALMLLASRRKLTLLTKLGEILADPWLPAEKRPLTLAALLTHRAGLPAWRPFYQQVAAAPENERRMLLSRLAALEPFEHEPETATLYSDLDFMLLQAVVEAVSGRDLDSFCRQEGYEPLGLPTLGFTPKRYPHTEQGPFAATEDGLIPGRGCLGEVHDENAWAAGGVAGHAGLFGTGPEVFRLAAWLYRCYKGLREKLGISPEVVRLFLTPAAPGARTPGFDVPTPGVSSAGRYFSPRSVGHTGFTGTSLWIDLELGQMVVLLTNRVHLGRDNNKIKAFRPRFHEAVSRALGFAGS